MAKMTELQIANIANDIKNFGVVLNIKDYEISYNAFHKVFIAESSKNHSAIIRSNLATLIKIVNE